MGRRERTADYFRKRLKTERELRGWSQVEMAKTLSDNGIPMHATTIAKIELGDRTVRIDEATAIADLLEVSLDALLGRKGMEDDRSHALSVLADESRAVIPELMVAQDRMHRAYQELANLWGLESHDRDAWNWDDEIPLEHKRALLVWDYRNGAAMMLSGAIEALTEVVRLRSVTAEEVRRLTGDRQAVIDKITRRRPDEA